MTTTNKEILRADVALADLASNGGLLNPEQANTFIDFILEEPTVLKQARVIRMNGPQRKINRLGFDQRILRAARQTGSAEDNGGNDRHVRKLDRAAPRTTQIELNTSEVIAEVRIPYEVLEDNIEGQSFEAHILRQIAQRAALDFEEWALWADTSNTSDGFMSLQDGWIKRALSGGHLLDWGNIGVSPDLFAEMLLSMPQKYLRNLPQMKAFISNANIIRYRQLLARRNTALGDRAISDNFAIQAAGITVEKADMMTAGMDGGASLLTNPQNLLWGIQRDITIETDKDIRAREHIIVLTARAALQVDDIDAVVIAANIGDALPDIRGSSADFPVFTKAVS